MVDKDQILKRLAADNPQFHQLDEKGAGEWAKVGFEWKPGATSWAVGPYALNWIADRLSPEMTTIETGAGHTTVLFAAMVNHHYCCTASQLECERIKDYLKRIGVPESKVTFVIGSTDETLPKLDAALKFDFAYIDGCHGYPYPALEWHFIDKHIKPGGLIGLDNAELRSVREHCEFLEENGAYEPAGFISELGVFIRFYKKLRDEDREWHQQAWSRAKRDPCDVKLRTRFKRKLSKWLKRHLF